MWRRPFSSIYTLFEKREATDLYFSGNQVGGRLYRNRDALQFEDVTEQTGLAHTAGWWNSITGGDFDEDGDTDYVVDNLGLNTRYEASPAEPVLTHFVQGREVPVPRRNRMLAQLPLLRQQFPDYESYATATISDLLSERQRERATVRRATRFASSYLENRSDGRFRIRTLPPQAQLAPLYGLLSRDVTGNGHLDVLAVGNSYAPNVITGRHDALIGVLLQGDGSGQFESASHRDSGFFGDGDGKGLAQLYDADGTDRRHELYYGEGYLSQSSRRLPVPPEADSVTVHMYDGARRTISGSPSAND